MGKPPTLRCRTRKTTRNDVGPLPRSTSLTPRLRDHRLPLCDPISGRATRRRRADSAAITKAPLLEQLNSRRASG